MKVLSSALTLLIILTCTWALPLSAQITVDNPGINGPADVINPPSGWNNCLNTPTTNDGTVHGTPTSPYEGNAFMSIHPLPGQEEKASTALSTALVAGESYRFSFWLCIAGLSAGPTSTWFAQNFGQNPGIMEIWGAKTPCGEDELLYTSPVIMPGSGWQRMNVTIYPSDSYTHLNFIPRKPNPSGLAPYMGMDLITSIYNTKQIPTVSEWGLILFALLLLNVGSVYISLRNRKTQMA